MKNHTALLAMLLAVFTAAPGQSPITNNADPAVLPLRLNVRIDQRSYRMSDTMTLEAQLTNVSDHAVFLNEWDLCWNFARGLVLRVTDAKGSDVRTDLLLDCVPPPPRAGDVYQFVKIDGGRFYGLVSEFKIRELVNKPGEYDLDVTFDSSISAKWVSRFLREDPISKLPLWTMENPTLKASRVHFKVVPQKSPVALFPQYEYPFSMCSCILARFLSSVSFCR